MTFGLTDQGLVVPRLPDILAELQAKLREKYGSTIDLSEQSVEGYVLGIGAEREALIYELIEILYGSIDPESATGKLLDALCALTGTLRRPATFSMVTLTLTGDPGTTVDGDSLVSASSSKVQFKTLGDATIANATAWTPLTTYAAGDRVTNAGNVYSALNAGKSGNSGGPTHATRSTDFAVLPDGDPGTAIAWLWLGKGTGFVDKDARAVDVGPIFVAANGIDTIDSVAGGLDGVCNLSDVTTGSAQQSEADLRLSRDAELAALGTSPPDALRARLLRVDFGATNPVIAVDVFYNNTDTTDADGVLPHSIEALVRGGADADIRAALWAAVSAGIRTVGNVTGTITDSQGRTQTVKFSRPTEVEIYVDVTLVKDPSVYPADGDDQVKAAIVAYGDLQATGKDAVAAALSAQVFKVAGVLDVTAVKIGTAPAPTLSATIPISLRQLATYDTGRIALHTSNGTP